RSALCPAATARKSSISPEEKPSRRRIAKQPRWLEQPRLQNVLWLSHGLLSGNDTAMKQVKSHILSAYCPWTDVSAWSSHIASGPRKQIKFTGSPAGLALPGDVGPFSREWQANSMDQPVDEHTKSDLVAIADARQLSAAQCNVL